MRYLITGIIFFAVCYLLTSITLAGFTGETQFGAGSQSLAWGDYDGDDDLDMAVGENGQNYLYMNNGDGTFTDDEQFGTGNTLSVAWGDYDNDGDLDLAVGNNGLNHLYVNEGLGDFTEYARFNYDEEDGEKTRTLAWGDYDNDGDLDLAVGNVDIEPFSGLNYLYTNEGDGTFTVSAQFNYENEETTYTLAWGDYDFDGDLDMAVANRRTYFPLYINDGNGNFTEEAILGKRYAISVAWGDYENDGDLDLALGSDVNVVHGTPNYLFINDLTETFSEEVPFGDFIHTTAYSIAWGDADNDGDLDLAIGNVDTDTGEYGVDQNYLYVKQDGCYFIAEQNFGNLPTNSIAWGDYDGDGDLDLAVANQQQKQNYLYINGENDEDYLIIHLVGHYHDQEEDGYSNRDGIGAKVLVYETGHLGEPDHLLGFREIEANGGWCGQDSIDAEFGIPSANRLVDILVIWPGSDGTHIEESWEEVETAQVLILHEGTGESYPGSQLR